MSAEDEKKLQDFGDLLLAAFHDAVLNDNITQLQVKFVPLGQTRERVVRVVVLPEDMKHVLGGS